MNRRRSFLQQLGAFAVMAKVNLFPWLHSNPPALVEDAMGLTRTINMLQAGFFAKHGNYATKSEILGSEGLRGLMQRKASRLPWLQRLNLESDEILPGLILDFASTSDGYIFTVSEKKSDEARNVVITDEKAIIYRATFAGEPPKAHDLASASAFPGAVPHDEFPDTPSRLSRFLMAGGGILKVLRRFSF